MQLIRYCSDYKKQDQGLVLAIGNFDGMHCGHQAVLRHTVEDAHKLGLKSAVMTFTPHPRCFFRPNETFYTLSTFRDKYENFKKLGIEKLFNIRFDGAFAALDARSFVQDLLLSHLNVKKVVVGSQFYFGKGGQASFKDLKRLCLEKGADAEAVEAVSNDSTRISSTKVRESLLQGDLITATKMLGKSYSITGRVCHGNALGRTLGFPTANVHFNGMQPPLKGVYAVKVHTVYGDFDGMCNAGMRPSIHENNKRFLLEVHLFNFSGDLYSTLIRVSFISKIRDETVFLDLEELKDRLKLDRKLAQELLF